MQKSRQPFPAGGMLLSAWTEWSYHVRLTEDLPEKDIRTTRSCSLQKRLNCSFSIFLFIRMIISSFPLFFLQAYSMASAAWYQCHHMTHGSGRIRTHGSSRTACFQNRCTQPDYATLPGRRRQDLNLRKDLNPFTGFRNRRHQPLGHFSINNTRGRIRTCRILFLRQTPVPVRLHGLTYSCGDSNPD